MIKSRIFFSGLPFFNPSWRVRAIKIISFSFCEKLLIPGLSKSSLAIRTATLVCLTSPFLVPANSGWYLPVLEAGISKK